MYHSSDKQSVYAWGRADYGELGIGKVTFTNSRCQHRPTRLPLPGLKTFCCGSMHNLAITGKLTQNVFLQTHINPKAFKDVTLERKNETSDKFVTFPSNATHFL